MKFLHSRAIALFFIIIVFSAPPPIEQQDLGITNGFENSEDTVAVEDLGSVLKTPKKRESRISNDDTPTKRRRVSKNPLFLLFSLYFYDDKKNFIIQERTWRILHSCDDIFHNFL